ncbi:MAG: hypothetical protein SFV21_19890 [Rhodospirillaceae bacterium]|nr:hypothetical protein [Rhodospirillaceae bacterium]
MTTAALAALMFAAAPAAAMTACDTLASHPEDPDKVGPGVEPVADLKAAIAACEAAVAANPNDRVQRYQLARVLFYDKQTDKSLPHLQFAADAGSQQAQFVLGYITDEGIQGVKKDTCKVEDLWVKSARQGRFAAQVSYANHVMTGRFGSCTQHADAAEIAGFLEAAKKQAGGFGYYAVVLADVLARDFAAWRAANGK